MRAAAEGAPSEGGRASPVHLAVAGLVGLVLVWQLWFATNTGLIADEFFELHLGARVARGEVPFSATWDYMKTPLFSYLLAGVVRLGGDGGDTVLTARMVMLPFTVLTLLAVAAGARRRFGSGGAVVLAVLAAACCTTFLDRGGRLRTDAVATSLFAVALASLMASGAGGARPAGWRGLLRPTGGAPFRLTGPGGLLRDPVVGAGLAVGAAFLVTQKSVYFVLASLAVCLLPAPGRRRLRDAGLFLGASGLVVGVYVAAFALAGLGPSCVLTTFWGGREGLAEVYRTASWGVTEVGRSPGFWLLALVGLGRSLAELRRPVPDARLAGAAAVAQVVLLLATWFHPNKWPYFYLIHVPTAAHLAAAAVAGSAAAFVGGASRPRLVVLVTVLGLVTPALLRVALTVEAPSTLPLQLATVGRVEALTLPDDAVFDGVGMVPTRPRAYHDLLIRTLAAYRAGGMPDIVASLVARSCKVFILNYRTNNLPPQERTWIARHFVHDWGNVFVAGAAAEVGPGRSGVLDLHAGGVYEVLWDGPGHVLVDGRAAAGRVRLDAGRHRAAADARGRVLLRYRPWVEAPPDLPPRLPGRLLARYDD